ARRRELRKFGLVVGGCFAILAVLFALRHKHPQGMVGCAAAAVILLGLAGVAPTVLSPFEKVWLKFGAVMGWINTRILLFAIFFLVLTPLSLLLRLFRRDALKR